MNNNSTVKSNIMIVDDNPANLKLLEEMLETEGHSVRSFPLGRLAIAASLKNPPDLLLMDVNMPEMDGYQTCDLLKSNPLFTNIPVIFLSALDETEDKVKAFRCGAADYITKPFQIEEVHSRVQTHLQLNNLQRSLERKNEELEEAVAERTRELLHANARLTLLDKSKTEFLKLLSHELRTPLNGVLGVAEIILSRLSDEDDDAELEQLYQRSRRRMIAILDDALLLAEIDAGTLRYNTTAVPLHSIVNSAIEQTASFAQSRRVAIHFQSPGPQLFADDFVLGHSNLLARAIQAILETAVKFATDGTGVQILREAAAGTLNVVMKSTGRQIPPNALGKFFEILAIEEALTPGGDLGLRPAMAQRLLALFGASASAANCGEGGVRLTVSLKLHP